MRTLGMRSQPVNLDFMKLYLVLSLVACTSLNALASTQATEPPARGSKFTFGIGVGAGPRFPGSKETEVRAVPMIDYQHESGLFASTGRGIGWSGGNQELNFSMAVAARGKRSERDQTLLGGSKGSQELHGMGDVKSSALGVFGVGARLGERLGVSVAAEVPLTRRENGAALHASAALSLLHSGADSVSLNAGLHFGDGKYLRTYFGVTPQQSANAGYATFTPEAGPFKADLSLNWSRQLNERWGLTAMAGVTHLLVDAARSPLARRRTAPQAGLLINYSF